MPTITNARPFRASAALAATTLTAVYNVATSYPRGAVINDIFICNRGGTDATFRVAFSSVAVAGSVPLADYPFYDDAVRANKTYTVQGIGAVPQGTYIWVYASTANVSVTVLGEELP